MSRLRNKVVIITGAGSGIGRSAAHRFSQEGASLVLFGRNADALAATKDELSGDAVLVPGDVTSRDDIDALVETARRRFGGIDGAFLNAGIAPFASIEESDEALYDECFNVNFRARFFMIRAMLPHLRAPTSIVLTATGLMHKPLPESSLWAAANAALRSLAMSLSVDLADRGIRINVLSPGPTDTPIYNTYGMDDESLAGLKEGLAAQTLLDRMARPEEMAAVALFLMSDESSYVVGEELVAAGGYGLR